MTPTRVGRWRVSVTSVCNLAAFTANPVFSFARSSHHDGGGTPIHRNLLQVAFGKPANNICDNIGGIIFEVEKCTTLF